MSKCDWWEQQTLMLRSRCNLLGRNGISGYLRRFCLLMWYNVWHVWCHFDGWVQNLKISTTSMLAFYLLLTTEVKCLRICKRGTMNELPVIGSLRLRTDFWDRHVADIVTRYKGTYGERFVWTSKKCDFGKRLWLFRSSFIIHGER